MKEVRESVNEAAGGIKDGLLESVRSLTGLSPG